MGRCIALLLFGLAVFIVSIQCVDPPPINWYRAETHFQYSKKHPNGTESLEDYSDHILMVGVGKLGKIVGSASSFCRHINPPNEQIVLLQATSKYFTADAAEVEHEPTNSCAPQGYGCITGVNNYCSVKPKTGLKAGENAILSATHKPKVGTTLDAVYLNKTAGFGYAKVNVRNFADCKKYFDPEDVYLVDEEEQLCTDQVNTAIGSDPVDLTAALLFEKSGDEYKLVGIETKAFGGVSLSSWPGYQCKEYEKGLCDP